MYLPDALDQAERERPSSTRQLMRGVAADPTLTAALREALSAYRPRCLIHGDIRRENWTLGHTRPDPLLKVLDWELSGAGDPAWDVGSVLADATLDVLRENVDTRAGVSGWPIASECAFAEFFASYTSEGGLVDLSEEAVRNQVVLYATARLLHVACEWADWQTDIGDGPAAQLVGQACQYLSRRGDAATWLASWPRH
jgi:aminoglycoside phosphotransferase (APT) family kinase protein